jgi:hypothetical protein
MRKNMLDAIREVDSTEAEDLMKQNANFFMLQNHINNHNAKIRGELPPPQVGAMPHQAQQQQPQQM